LAAGLISLTISRVNLSAGWDGQALVVQQVIARAQAAAVQRHDSSF